MSVDDGIRVASSTASESDAISAEPAAMHEPGTGRGSDEVDSKTAQADAHNAPHTGRAQGDATTPAHAHKGHGHGAPWQSLLPGVMK
jgi:hypothetical protein